MERSNSTPTATATQPFVRCTRGLGRIAAAFAAALLTLAPAALAQLNSVGARPLQGWSTYSQQTIVPSSSVMNEQNILAQSDAMRASGLTAHGFQYINLDAGWSGNTDSMAVRSGIQLRSPHSCKWFSTSTPTGRRSASI